MRTKAFQVVVLASLIIVLFFLLPEKEIDSPLGEDCPQGFKLQCGICTVSRGWDEVTPSHPARVVEEIRPDGISFLRFDLGVEEAPGVFVCDGDTVWVSPTEARFYNRDLGFSPISATWDGPEFVPCPSTVEAIWASYCK